MFKSIPDGMLTVKNLGFARIAFYFYQIRKYCENSERQLGGQLIVIVGLWTIGSKRGQLRSTKRNKSRRLGVHFVCVVADTCLQPVLITLLVTEGPVRC